MELSILEQRGESLAVLHIKDASVGFANALRRTLISQMPCFAIEEVDFYENNSALYNEILANRLGMVPLTFDPKAAEDTKVSLTLNSSGPATVYSKDLVSGDEKITAANGEFPIAELADKQNLRLEAWAVRGTARKHAKFQCAHASYAHFPTFTVKKNSQKLQEFVKAIPASCLDSKGNVVAWKCDAAVEFAQNNPDSAEYKEKEDEFVFTIESYNNVSALGQLKAALEIMGETAKELKKLLK